MKKLTRMLHQEAELEWTKAAALNQMFYCISQSIQPETNPIVIAENDFSVISGIRTVKRLMELPYGDR